MSFIAPDRRNRLLWMSAVLTLVVMFLMNVIGKPLITPAAPLGIVSFEFGGTVQGMQAILDSWDANARVHAGFSLGFDYVFMLVYAFFISLACLASGERLKRANWPLAGWAAGLGWALWLAAGLDGVENFALTKILFGTNTDPWPQVAFYCASLKFLLIILGLIYSLVGLAVKLLRK
jgi:hypothetical protein